MDTREMIMETAFASFLEKGFEGVSLNEIIKRTEMTKGAFYHYFKSKEALLKEVVNTYLYSFVSDHVSQMDMMEGNTMDKIGYAIKSISAVQHRVERLSPSITDARSFMILLQQALKLDEELRTEYHNRMEKTKASVAMMLKQGQLNGEVREDIDVKAMAELVSIVIKGTLFENSMMSEESIDTALERHMNNLVELIMING